MKSDRLQKLQEFYKEEPDNPFIIYGIAMEYEKTDVKNALNYYLMLYEKHVDYLPTYYQLAHLYWDMEEYEKAGEVFNKGLLIAEKQKNFKILNELKTAYNNFQMEL